MAQHWPAIAPIDAAPVQAIDPHKRSGFPILAKLDNITDSRLTAIKSRASIGTIWAAYGRKAGKAKFHFPR
jgi:hypothetical protein